jgi:TRAP-type uncharacterized transport system substrate-binding protein
VVQASAGIAFAARPPPATPITIGGGTVDSAAYRWSSALSEILSRPPGLPDCEQGSACGVPGVIASARTYDDAGALLSALRDGQLTMAVAPSLPVFDAICGSSKSPGKPPAPFTILKLLYRQPLYIVVRAGPKPVARPLDWIGGTLVVGIAGSDSERLGIALIESYGVPRGKVKLMRLPTVRALAAMRSGAAVVGIFIGHGLDGPLAELIGHGFTLMSLPDSPGRDRLLKAVPVLEPSAVPPGTFSGLAATSTVAQAVAWVAGPALDVDLARRLVGAAAEPHNLARIEERVDPIPPVPEGEAYAHLPGPAAPGARVFAEKSHLPVGTIGCPAAPAG